MELIFEALGIAAGLCTNVSFIPQIWRIRKLRSAEEFSLLFLCILLFGVGLWLLYGVFIDSLAVKAANAVAFVEVLAIIISKLKYRRPRSE
jgi:MtN3 and saliva related transmembrane protein